MNKRAAPWHRLEHRKLDILAVALLQILSVLIAGFALYHLSSIAIIQEYALFDYAYLPAKQQAEAVCQADRGRIALALQTNWPLSD